MFPWGALIGLAGQAVSGIASAINNKKQQQMADAEAARQQAYYEAKANEDPLSRSENQHLLGQYDRQAQQQIENARNVAAIKGMTPEYSLGVQKAVAEGRANLMSGMSADASARKDYFDQKGEQVRHTKAVEDLERKAARQQTYDNLAANAASAVGSIMDGYSASKAAKAQANNDGVNKIATSIPDPVKTLTIEKPNTLQNPFGKDAIGFIPNSDGFTYTKDGMQYIKNPDGSYKLYFPSK